MKVVTIDSEIMSGTPCFAGTRVPVKTLNDYLNRRHTVEDFLADFPYVDEALVRKYLDQALDLIVTDARKSA